MCASLSRRPDHIRPRGFALVVVLALMALLLITVVAMLATAGLDRSATRAHSNVLQAQLAAESGLEAAKQALLFPVAAAANEPSPFAGNDFFILSVPDGAATYAFMGVPETPDSVAGTVGDPTDRNITYYPLFSLNKPSSQRKQEKKYPALPKISDFGTRPATSRVYPWMAAPTVQWITVNGGSAPTDKPVMRYCFWMEDLAGTVDPTIAGTLANQRTTGKRPEEIGLFAIFNPSSLTPPPTGPSATLASDSIRPMLLTQAVVREAGGATDSQTVALHPNTRGEDEPQLIPRGFGFRDAGKPKVSLNKLLSDGGGTDANVNTIAGIIRTNLPNFIARAGGFPSDQDYLKTLAASMIDYADTDSTPTVGTGYRGIDSQVLLKQAFHRYEYKGKSFSGGIYYIKIEKFTYIEVWNLTSKDATFGGVNIELKSVGNGGAVLDKVADSSGSSGSATPFDTSPANYAGDGPLPSPVPAQSFRIIKFSHGAKDFPWGPTPPPNNGNINIFSSAVAVNLYVDGKLIDRQSKGMDRTTNRALNLQSGSVVMLGSTAPYLNVSTGSMSDPRSSWFSGRQWKSASYTNSSWGGLAKFKSSSTLATPDLLCEPAKWMDGGHNSAFGAAPTSETELPAVAAGRVTEVPDFKKRYIQLISNSGSYDSAAEIGAIFDPALWIYDASPGREDLPVDATAASQAGDGTGASNGAGGGFTLRIGRREFAKFDQPGQRAWQLLDLISANEKRRTVGLINLNTASRDALRALAAGIKCEDEAATPANLNPFYTGFAEGTSGASVAQQFADDVIARRPFLSAAQLSSIPYFSSDASTVRKTWGSGSASSNPSELNDTGYEGQFRRLYDLTTVRSRNFRVFITGQTLDAQGNPSSTTYRVYQIYVRPTRDAADPAKITALSVELIYESSL